MSRKPDKKEQYSKKILQLLADRPGMPMEALSDHLLPSPEKHRKYALNRSVKGLIEAGLVTEHHSGQRNYARLTAPGRKKAASLKLDDETTLVNLAWDHKWRMVLLDFPEERKTERDSIRYLLKKAGFKMLKNTVWVSPYPFEYLFMNIKKDLGLSTEIMIIVTNSIDPATEKELAKISW